MKKIEATLVARRGEKGPISIEAYIVRTNRTGNEKRNKGPIDIKWSIGGKNN